MLRVLLLVAAAHGSLHFVEDDYGKALAEARGRPVRRGNPADPKRPERLNRYMSSLIHIKDWRTCVQTGLREAKNTPASALGADFQSYAFGCAGRLDKGDADAARMHELAI